MSDAVRTIEGLVYDYAERIDSGDFDGVAALFAHGRIRGTRDGAPDAVFEGESGVRAMYEFAVRVHDGGTPRTKHFTTNLRVVVDEDAGTARASAYYCVTQATPELPLQVVVTGSYRDTFHVVDGRWWFDTRVMVVDQVGDTSQHLAF